MLDKKLVSMLYENGHGYSDIARQFNVSRQRIHQIIANYRNFGHGRLSKKELKKIKKDCKVCRQPAKDLHHIDRNNANDNVKNLMPLCEKCHYEIHKGERRKYAGRKPKQLKLPNPRYDWSLKYKECIKCLQTDFPHNGKGLCTKCYNKLRYIKDKELI